MKADVKTMLELRKLILYINDEEITALDYIEKLEDIISNIDNYVEYKLWNYIDERAEYLKCRDELHNIYKDIINYFESEGDK